MKQRVERQIGEQTLAIETGFLAKQAAGSVLVTYGETVVLVACATGRPAPESTFFPLTCDYRERVAAAGKFPGGFLKREGRPTIKETLTSRLMDRPIRPLFPGGLLRRSAGPGERLGQRPSERRRRAGDEWRLGGPVASRPLPFQGPLGQRAARPGQRPVRSLPHASTSSKRAISISSSRAASQRSS